MFFAILEIALTAAGAGLVIGACLYVTRWAEPRDMLLLMGDALSPFASKAETDRR